MPWDENEGGNVLVGVHVLHVDGPDDGGVDGVACVHVNVRHVGEHVMDVDDADVDGVDADGDHGYELGEDDDSDGENVKVVVPEDVHVHIQQVQIQGQMTMIVRDLGLVH